MRIRLLDLNKRLTIFGVVLDASNPIAIVDKAALLNTARMRGRNRSSDIVDIRAYFQAGLLEVSDGFVIETMAQLDAYLTDELISAVNVAYHDVAPLLGVSTVQAAIDSLKASVDAAPKRLADLEDVRDATPTNRNLLIGNGASWESSTIGLVDLSDVGSSTPTNNNVLLANGTSWESSAVGLANLSDVNSATPTIGHTLMADGTKWSSVSLQNSMGYIPPIDTLIGLAALPASQLPDGTQIYVNSVEDIYVLDKAASHSVDGATVLAATGGGYWIARLYGRWDDQQGSIMEGAGSAALTTEAFRDTAFLMTFMRHDQLDALNYVYQFPHRWDYTTVVTPHLHVLPCADPPTPLVARFNGYFAWSRVDYAAAPLPALSGWTQFGPVDLTVNPGDLFVHKIVKFGAFSPPAWARESTCLLIWFRRNGTDPADTFNTSKTGGTQQANLGLLSSDAHFRVHKNGTEAEYPT